MKGSSPTEIWDKEIDCTEYNIHQFVYFQTVVFEFISKFMNYIYMQKYSYISERN